MAWLVLFQPLMTGTFPMRIGLCALWLLTIGVGIATVLNYQSTSGQTGATPKDWPSGTQIMLDSKRDTLVMFAHPRCSCTRASMEELNRLLVKCGEHVAANIVFFKPDNFPADWERSDLRRSATSIPGATVLDDTNGVMAQKFGAETSGFVLLYDTRGELLFKGGITDGRGHEGDNAGEEAIVALATGKNSAIKQTQVFGCSLLDKNCSTKEIAK
jgi:hypothetical protein